MFTDKTNRTKFFSMSELSDNLKTPVMCMSIYRCQLAMGHVVQDQSKKLAGESSIHSVDTAAESLEKKITLTCHVSTCFLSEFNKLSHFNSKIT